MWGCIYLSGVAVVFIVLCLFIKKSDPDEEASDTIALASLFSWFTVILAIIIGLLLWRELRRLRKGKKKRKEREDGLIEISYGSIN